MNTEQKYFRQAIFREKNKFPYALINLIEISKTKRPLFAFL